MPIRSLKILATLASSLLLALWLMQHNIEQYWQQTYYHQSPLAALQKNRLWRSGDALKQHLMRLLGAGGESHHPASLPRINIATAQAAPAAAQTVTAPENPTVAPPVAEPVATTLPDPAQLAELAADAPAPDAQTLWENNNELAQPITSAAWLADADPVNLARLRPAPDAAEPWQNQLGSALQQSHPISAAHYLPVASADWTHNPVAVTTGDNDEHPIDLSETETVAAEEAPPADAAAVAPEPAGKTPIQLGENDRVLLIGDSMMQSLAPHIQRELLARHHIKSINRGKPSSGLRYPDYYNWPEHLAAQLEENPDVRLIIVLLGANDPQDTPNPAAPEQKLNFGTPEWENYYRGEIRKILQTAAARGAKTLWIGPPLMKAPKYSKKITYLDGLIADEVEKAQQHYQNTNRLFAKADGSYTAFLPDERGKPVAVRKGDGIHFTGPGEKILTRHIIEQINP
ncbi:SGNH family hydrolase [Cardiobacterium hominis]|uniref:SGNH/GDSL hydrolase family protein n=1 Tax=Cardiobacterium hominis TaxID=2718 RepID=UPI0028E20FBF|nr:SGNH family hydrolase [Cardiobacterium hominis]